MTDMPDPVHVSRCSVKAVGDALTSDPASSSANFVAGSVWPMASFQESIHSKVWIESRGQ